MRERIARALAPTSWAALDKGACKPGDHHEVYRAHSLVQADAVLEAMREPSDRMLSDGAFQIFRGERITEEDTDAAKRVWRAMVKAARQ